MKTTYHYVCAGLVAMAALASSCSDFLDATPDSRIQVNNEEKVKALLTTAYPQATFVRVTELASDNADDLNGDLNGNYDRFSEQCYRWQPVTESDNENPTMIKSSDGKRIVVVDDAAQIELLNIPQVAGFCTVAEDGPVSYYKKEAALES